MSVEELNAWPVLSESERRVLGVLVEKQKTTDTYPLTLNSVVTGSNQRSNRDPVLNFTDEKAEEALTEAQHKGLVMRVISGRADKWRHLLYETWKVSSVELAVLTELLLRGPQTEGELRGRASRMDEIADVDGLRQILEPLVERKLVVYLTPKGKRGTLITHGFHDPQELERLKRHFAHAMVAENEQIALSEHPVTSVLPAARSDSHWADVNDQMAELRQQFVKLEKQVAAVTSAVQQIQEQLGLAPPAAS